MHRLAAAGPIGEHVGDEATGARLCGGHALFAVDKQLQHSVGKQRGLGGKGEAFKFTFGELKSLLQLLFVLDVAAERDVHLGKKYPVLHPHVGPTGE